MNLLDHIPIETVFKGSAIANKLYPNKLIRDRMGRDRNVMIQSVNKRLRSIKGILEVRQGEFWAAREIF